MKQPLRQVNYYKRALLRGFCEGFAADASLALRQVQPGAPCVYITPMFDTGDADTDYNRLAVQGDFSGARLEVIVAATDLTMVELDGKTVVLAQYFADPAVPAADKAQALRALPHVRRVDAADLLLHELKGRYVWAYLRAVPELESHVTLEGLRLEFPRCSFTEYFPEIYGQNEFFSRYLAVFEAQYLDLERKIDEIPAQLDYETTDDVRLAQLAQWLGIDNSSGALSAQQLRAMISRIDLFQGGKGTRAALEAVVELATGIKPRIVEYFQWAHYPISAEQRKLSASLYGAGENDFCVLLNLCGRTGPLPLDAGALDALIEEYSPLGARHKLVFLRRCSHLDTHCYLGVNSSLSVPRVAAADNVSLGGYVTLG